MSTHDAMIEYWDGQAAAFDQEPDHGLTDPTVRAAWADLLHGWLPARPSDVVDVGCGTGSLSSIVAEQGHRITAVDAAPRMVELARSKLAGADARLVLGDASAPPLGGHRFDVVLVRHVLWALPDPADAVRRWIALLRPTGRLVMIEGVWGVADPVGIDRANVCAAVEPLVDRLQVVELSNRPALWGRDVADDRYAVVAQFPTAEGMR